jgi:hypothetical protein
LNVFGFLTSEELRAAGYKANNGLRDQRTAILWVQKHIRDFGGDPNNVTLAGMSAGGGKDKSPPQNQVHSYNVIKNKKVKIKIRKPRLTKRQLVFFTISTPMSHSSNVRSQ